MKLLNIWGRSRVLGFFIAPIISLYVLAIWNKIIDSRFPIAWGKVEFELQFLYPLLLFYCLPIYFLLRKEAGYPYKLFLLSGGLLGFLINLYFDLYFPLTEITVANLKHGYWGLPLAGMLGGGVFWLLAHSRRSIE